MMNEIDPETLLTSDEKADLYRKLLSDDLNHNFTEREKIFIRAKLGRIAG